MTAVDQDKKIRKLFTLQNIIFDDPLDIFTSLFSPLGKTITGEIDQIPLSVDKEMIDKHCLPRFLRGHGKPFFTG